MNTDARDAEHPARLALLGQITAVRVPGPGQEAARDLVRAREDVRADLMRARYRVSKLLLRHGLVYSGGQAWTDATTADCTGNGSTTLPCRQPTRPAWRLRS